MPPPYPTRHRATPISSAPSAPPSQATESVEELLGGWRRYQAKSARHRHSANSPPSFFRSLSPQPTREKGKRQKRDQPQHDSAADVWYSLMTVVKDLDRLPELFPTNAETYEEMRQHVFSIIELSSKHMIHSYECGCRNAIPSDLKPIASKVRRWVRELIREHSTRHVHTDAMTAFSLNLEMQKILADFHPSVDLELEWIRMRKRPPAAEAFLNAVVRTVNAVRDLGTTRRSFRDQCNELGPMLTTIYNTVNKRMSEGLIPWLPEAVTSATRRFMDWVISVINGSDFGPSSAFELLTMSTWVEHFAELTLSLTVHHRRNLLKRQLKHQITTYRHSKIFRHLDDPTLHMTKEERRMSRSEMRNLKEQYEGFHKAIVRDPVESAWGPEVKAWMRDLFGE